MKSGLQAIARRTLVATLVALGPCVVGQAATLEEVCRLVQSRSICLESDAAGTAVIEALLRAVDPEARILSPDQVAAVREGPNVQRCEEWPEGIGYVRVSGLWNGGGRQIATQLVAWAAAARTGAIMDLRGAGGAGLSSVEELAGLFIPPGQPLFRVKPWNAKAGEPRRAVATAGSIDRLPVMLLVDEQTRDACAVLAGALKGRTAVMLIGAPTRPEPCAREFICLPSGETVFLATGLVVEAAGEDHPLPGVKPDVTVDEKTVKGPAVPREGLSLKPPSEKAIEDRRLMAKVAGDACLARATDILLGLKALDARGRMGKEARAETATDVPAASAPDNSPSN